MCTEPLKLPFLPWVGQIYIGRWASFTSVATRLIRCAGNFGGSGTDPHDEDYRRRILTQLNRGEGRHAVARAICYGQRGEIRKRYREGQEDQLGALGLVTNAVVLWNSLYMQEALSHIRTTTGETPDDEHIARLSPLMHGHINMLGHYTFTLPEDILKGELRPLNININNEVSS
jgi:hypothetical protein